jgi:hypothetical protein
MENEDCEAGAHEWELIDDSFDHQFGVELIYYYQCAHCGLTKDADSNDDYGFEDN